MWHPAGDRPGRTARRGQGDGLPGDRLRPAGREPLHQPPLLGGRRAQHRDAHRLDGALPGPRRRTRQPAAGPVARLLAGAGARDREDARGRGVLPVRLHLLGLRPGRTADRTGARRLRALGALGAPSPAYAQARAASLDTGLIRNQVAPFVDTGRQADVQIAGHLPDGRRLPRTARGARGDARQPACRSNAPR